MSAIVLRRRPDQEIVLGANVVIHVGHMRGNGIPLRISLPREIPVNRGEAVSDWVAANGPLPPIGLREPTEADVSPETRPVPTAKFVRRETLQRAGAKRAGPQSLADQTPSGELWLLSADKVDLLFEVELGVKGRVRRWWCVPAGAVAAGPLAMACKYPRELLWQRVYQFINLLA